MSDDDIAIKAEGISKVFRIGAKENLHDSLGGAILDFIKSPLENYRKYRSLYKFDDLETAEKSGSADIPSDIIWALKDVSFQVKRGEVLGIIGRNGAGKSTLLKVLTRITPPSRGRVEVRGRVSSLLEVGTGFHQELTGRENIYLNGTILGMKKTEVDRKFDEIVEFSGVEKFLDTPVKRYSSGMRVRLAFSVAAHLEPEIMIIDEVLAVGDASFQQKCLDKMQDVGKEGRTVLFVSHNMPAVSMLCSRAILLDEGTIIDDGSPHDIVSEYLKTGGSTKSSCRWDNVESAPGGEVACLRSVRIVSRDGQILETADIRQEIGIEMTFDVIKSGFVLLPHYYLTNDEGVYIFGSLEQDPNWYKRPRPKGRYISTVWIPGNYLSDGTVFVNCNLITRQPDIVQFAERQVIAFNVQDNMGDGTARGQWAGRFPGIVRPLLEWTTQYNADEKDEIPMTVDT